MESNIGSNKAVYTTDVPEDRIKLVEMITRLEKPVVMFIGDVDSGKTTALTFVANELINLGYRVGIVDSDLGQKGILPPATVSLGIVEENFPSLSAVEPYMHYFIGITTPAQYIGETVVGVKRLVDVARSMADVVLIDTTGFVTGPGFDLKRLKIEAVRPDLVVFIQSTGEREHSIEELMAVSSPLAEAVLLKRSERVRPYSHEERRAIRAAKWRTYFSGSSPVLVDLSTLRVSGTSMFSGRSLTAEEREIFERLHDWVVLAGWKDKEVYTIVKADSSRRPYNRSVIKAVDFETLSNLLVGFIDELGFCLGLGILKWPRLSEGLLEVLTPLGPEELSRAVEVRFGRVRVTEVGEELALLRRDDL